MNVNNTFNHSCSNTLLVKKESPVVESMLVIDDAFELLPENNNNKESGGLRTQGYFKKNHTNMPLVTVVTVVYNGEKLLEETIQSVIGQTYENIEYIIIDGGSSDGTLDIIKKYEAKIDYWISEKDQGIYDAMNKGLELLTGTWVSFMNVGDRFYSLDILTNVFENNRLSMCDVIYGDLETQKGLKKQARYNGVKTFLRRTIGHQSLFVKSKLHHEFNEKYKISSDYELLVRLSVSKCKFYYLNMIVAFYDVDKSYMTKEERNSYSLKRVLEKLDISSNWIPYPYKLYSMLYYSMQIIKFKFKSILISLVRILG